MPQASPDVSHKLEVLEEQAQEYLRQQRPQLAIPVLRQIISLDTNNLNAHANLGVLLFFQGNYSEAMPEMRTALQLEPSLWKIEALLGVAEKRTGDPNAAQNHLEEAFPHLDDKKIQKQAGLQLIELDSAVGRLEKATVISEQLENLVPQDPQILFAAYEISAQMMMQTLLNMMIAAPDSAEMHMAVAGELARQGDHAGAIAQYREAIRLNPDLPGVHFELAEQLRTSPDPALNAQAESEYRTALKVNQFDENAWRELGETAASRGDFKAALEDYSKALALQPRDSQAETDSAIALIASNKATDATSLLESAIRDDPTNAIAHYRLSVLYRKAGRAADSEREMETFFHYRNLKDKMGRVFRQMHGETYPK